MAAAAQLARLPLDPPTLIPFITHVPFMAVSAWFGGLGPGLLTAALCTLESMYFASAPVGSFRVEMPHAWFGVGALAFSGLVNSFLFDRLKRARRAEAEGHQRQEKIALRLEARERTLESILENSPAAIAVLSGSDFTFTTVNPAYRALAPEEPMVGRTVAEVWPDAAPLVLPLLQVVRNAQTPYHAMAMAIPRRVGRDGPLVERYFTFSYVPVPGLASDGGLAVLVVAIEVTEQKKVEQDLRAVNTELTAIYANAPVILLVVDEDLRVEKLNELAQRLAGRALSELLGLRHGGALGCLNALSDPRGCGYGPNCAQCPLRLAAIDSVHSAVRHESIEAWIPYSVEEGHPEQRCFLVSTAPLPYDHRHKALICAQDITVLKKSEIDLRRSVDQLKSALSEKTVLLQEVHHRVKNNLAVISSLLNMKADVTDDAVAKVALEDSQRRVHSIALIHELLYGSEHLDRINFADYTQQLVQVLTANFGGEPGRIAIRMDMEPIELGLHSAVPAALILNELVSNALKHAFPGGRRGEVHISFRESEPGNLELAIEDDGVGSPDVLAERKTKSLGLQIVRILTTQLGGTLRQEPSGGTRVVLQFQHGAARQAGR